MAREVRGEFVCMGFSRRRKTSALIHIDDTTSACTPARYSNDRSDYTVHLGSPNRVLAAEDWPLTVYLVASGEVNALRFEDL